MPAVSGWLFVAVAAPVPTWLPTASCVGGGCWSYVRRVASRPCVADGARGGPRDVRRQRRGLRTAGNRQHDAAEDAYESGRDERCCCEGGEFHGKRRFPSPALSASRHPRLAALDVASLCHAARGMVGDR